MTNQPVRRPEVTATLLTALWAVTVAHHVYGGVAFGTPARTVLAIVFTAVFAGTVWLGRLGARRRWAARTYPGVLVVFWVLWLGCYEGGYNHTLYVLLRQTGSADLVQRLYPAGSDAVISDDIFFQGTGILTLLVAIALGLALLRRPRRKT
ncbi:hypothetical protein [Plantactinospora sp. WMMB782]|uniref:hypothetical protein n=1 Tax=Plantactinospora sp. WMMB782 TaxID=3404121 RepID=UPI003B9574FB